MGPFCIRDHPFLQWRPTTDKIQGYTSRASDLGVFGDAMGDAKDDAMDEVVKEQLSKLSVEGEGEGGE